MADRYVFSGAAGAGTGADWANAYTSLVTALTAGSAGDTYYLAHDHAESQGSTLTVAFKGTSAAPDRVLCVNRAGSVPPVSADLTTGASLTSTGAFNISLGSSSAQVAYVQGVTFNAGSGAVTAKLTVNAGYLYLKNCKLNKLGTSSTGTAVEFAISSGQTGSTVVLDNTTVKFGNTGDGIARSGVKLIWKNTPNAIDSGGATPTTLFQAANVAYSDVFMDGVDLSLLASKAFNAGGAPASYRLVNCKLASGMTFGTPANSTARITVENSDSGATGYRQEIYDYAGTLTPETTIVRTGGASDGVQAIAHKIVATSNCKYQLPFESFPIAVWCDSTGAKTLTMEIINDGTTLKAGEVWLDVEYMGSSATPVSSLATTGRADALASTGSDLPTSTVSWTTTGLGSPVKQYIQASFTVNTVGYVRAVLKVAKTPLTLYVCPKLTLA